MKQILVYSRNTDLIDFLKDSASHNSHLYFALNPSRVQSLLRMKQISTVVYDKLQINERDVEFLSQIRTMYPELRLVITYLYFRGLRESEQRIWEFTEEIVQKPCDPEHLSKLIFSTLPD